MSVELLQTLSLVAYIVAGVFLMVSIALFFILDVRRLYGDVTGANARKAIENIRQQNEKSGNKAYKPSYVNSSRGRLTDKITPSGQLEPNQSSMGGSPGTEKFSTTELAPASDATTVLSLDVNETTLLSSTDSNLGETTVLSEDETSIEEGSQPDFIVDVEMGFTESVELIE